MIALWIILGVIAIIVIAIIGIYNKLVHLRMRVKNAWAQIDTQLKRRFDLIPNLVETVKGYMVHEEKTLKEIVEARNNFASAEDVKGKADANNVLSNSLKSIFALSEAYPDLKANENFKDLSNQLTRVEEDIANSRKYYNGVVKMFNNLVELFPSNLFAGMFGYHVMTMFEISDKERENVKVEF